MGTFSATSARDKRILTYRARNTEPLFGVGICWPPCVTSDRIPPAPNRGFSFPPPAAITSNEMARPDRRAPLNRDGQAQGLGNSTGGVVERQREKSSMEVREVLSTRKEEKAERHAPLTDSSRLLPRQPVPFTKGIPHTVTRHSRPQERGSKFQPALTGCQKPQI
jgi:hypothetical protein